MKLVRLLILVMSVSMLSCSDDDDVTPICDQSTIISATQFANAMSDFVTINEVKLDGGCLLINFTASGCDGNSWETKLIDSEVVNFSLPPQRHLKFVLDNNEACLAIFTKEVTFDVSELKVEGNQVLLNIVDSEHQVSYMY